MWSLVTYYFFLSFMKSEGVHVHSGWLESVNGLHTFRIESIAHGKAAPVDELQIQGISNPGLLRKVIHCPTF